VERFRFVADATEVKVFRTARLSAAASFSMTNAMPWNRAARWTTLLVLAGSIVLGRAAIDYVAEIKPLLTEQCYKCHGASQQKGELRLDTVALALKGGDNGASIKPGQSAESLLIQAVKGTHDSISQMPYKKPPLSDAQIALLARWIDEGAKAPANEQPESDRHWAFAAPQQPKLPALTKTQSGVRNPIDLFIRARLEKENITPAPEANRATLLRRVSLDLIGLPPTPEELEAFLKDQQPGAYERVVDRLLASPHYGERWGRWWLDAARYADSNGYSIDAPRQIWKYRDWVVAALNRDMPFDQFTIWQLAGDLIDTNTLPPRTSPLEPVIATGFNRHTQINQEGGIDPEQFRVESVMDRVNTFGTVFLGLTVACAQCHDHKFDPIKQREYYQLYAFFNNTVEDGHGKGTPGAMIEIPGETEENDNLEKEIEEARGDLERFLDTKGSDVTSWEQSLTDEQKSKLKSTVREAIKKAWSGRSLAQKRAVYGAFRADDADFKTRHTRLTRLERKEAKPVTTLVMQELKQPRETHLFIKGDFTRPADKVKPGLPAALHPMKEHGDKERDLNRLDLARWVIDPSNPVTSRVIVNRVWQHYFGRGLVETENDFGTQGSMPTHPELLDWLAIEFMTGGERGERSEGRGEKGSGSSALTSHFSPHPWSMKHLHRLIVTSATYRQSSRVRPELASADPVNKLLARQSRVRLDAEIVRDAALTASGLLSRKLGGPPVYPPQPDGVMTLGQVKRSWTPSKGEDRYRRGLYTFLWRATPHPALAVFDAPDAFSACTRRLRSNTPLQALTLLNDQQFYEFAEALAARILKASATNDAERIEHAFRVCLSRPPTDREKERVTKLLRQQNAQETGDEEARRAEAWKTVARVLLNLDETITRE
jgi:mono/diheme cytochrome c family protein